MKTVKTLYSRYRQVYEDVSMIPQQNDLSEVVFFADLVNHKKKLNILDLGCGEGRLSVFLARKGHRVTASDISLGYLRQVKNLAKENSVKIKIISCDIEKSIAQFFKEKFDVIYLMDVIEHLRNPTAALSNIRKLMKHDGVLIIHTPNVFSIYRIFRYLFKKDQLENYYDLKKLGDLHFQTYDYLTLEKTLNFLGLKIIELIPTKINLYKFSRFKFLHYITNMISKSFPFFSETLLLRCQKAKPIDLNLQIAFWKDIIKTR